jgi:hypothetical protein
MADRIAPAGEYDYDVAEYSVERHYDYPRFVCYDCHAYASWRYWDPYSAYCSRFRIVIYDDWYYYPYRRRHYGYGGTVIVRPYRPGPRYVFKDADHRNDYITRVAARPRDSGDDRRTPIERDRTSTDVGGRGAVPAPVSPRRRAPDAATPKAGSGEVRRRPETRNPAGTRSEPEKAPSEQRRRAAPAQTRAPTTDRDRAAPSAESRRRPSEGRSAAPRPQTTERRGEPRVREPSRQPSRESGRQAPAERSRGEPRVKDSSPPRSSGEPQLKRRRD